MGTGCLFVCAEALQEAVKDREPPVWTRALSEPEGAQPGR